MISTHSPVQRNSQSSAEIFSFLRSGRLIQARDPLQLETAFPAQWSSDWFSQMGVIREEARRRGVAEPWIVGALPFQGPGHWMVPQRVSVREWMQPEEQGDLNRSSVSRLVELPAAAEYGEQVRAALSVLQQNEVQKVVLSRALDLEYPAERPVDAAELFRRLSRIHASGYIFSVRLPERGALPRTLVGASPELLVERRGNQVIAHPLAGSLPKSSPLKKEQQKQELLTSEKDRREHAFVVEDIVEKLRPFCSALEVPASPSIVETPQLLHLGTRIVGTLNERELTASALAQIVHPTPAICGYPTPQARQLLQELEPFERDFFAGAVGYEAPNGDGVWAVSIRCAEIQGTHVRLYAGAGIVLGSSPEQEVTETGAKLSTMLHALGVQPPAHQTEKSSLFLGEQLGSLPCNH